MSLKEKIGFKMRFHKRKEIVMFMTFLALVNQSLGLLMPSKSDQNRLAECDISKGWHQINNLKIGQHKNLPVKEFKSNTTGLRVILIPADIPIVRARFTLATEVFTLDGLSTALSYMLVSGSEEYPYKRVLDLLGQRCLSGHETAEVFQDKTMYEVFAAGSSGLLNIVPVYLDHILFPLLSNYSFATEVHHITSTGEDSGIVYSGSKGRVKTRDTLVYSLIELLYPGNSSIASRAIGSAENFRTRTSPDRIREYHKKYYRPENLVVTIVGQVSPQEVFEALGPTEEKIRNRWKVKGKPAPLEKPLQRDMESPKVSAEMTADFLSKELNKSHVWIGWRVPGKINDNLFKVLAFDVLMTYLTSNSASPLRKAFVDIPQPLATGISFVFGPYWEAAYGTNIQNVPVDRIDQVKPTFNMALQSIIDDPTKNFDISQIHAIIDNWVLHRRKGLKNDPYSTLISQIELYTLYSTKPDQMKDFLEAKVGEEKLTALKLEDADFWFELIRNLLTWPQMIVKGNPNASLLKDLHKKEKQRIKEQKEKLGAEGLLKAGEEIKKASDAQKIPSNAILAKFPFADVGSIKYKNLTSYNYTSLPKEFDLGSIPFRFLLDDIQSDLVRYYMFLDMDDIATEDRKYLPLLEGLLLDSPLKSSNGTVSTLKDINKRKEKVSLKFNSYLGYYGGSYSHLMMFNVECALDNYISTVQLLKESLFDVEFSVDRTLSILNQLLNAIPNKKRNPSTVLSDVYRNLYFNQMSYKTQRSFLRQKPFLEEVSLQLNRSSDQVLTKLNNLKNTILGPNRTFVYMAADLTAVIQKHGLASSQVWKGFYDSSQYSPTPPNQLVIRYPVKSENLYRNHNSAGKHLIVGLPASETCILRQGILYEDTDWENDDIAAVQLMLDYLFEIFQIEVSGKWATMAAIYRSVTDGRITLSLDGSLTLASGYSKCMDIIHNYTRAGSAEWNSIFLESVKGSLIYKSVKAEESTEEMVKNSLQSYLQQTDDSKYSRRYAEKVASVTLDQIRIAANKYLPRFFDPTKTHTAIVCAPNEVQTVMEQFKEFNLTITNVDLEAI